MDPPDRYAQTTGHEDDVAPEDAKYVGSRTEIEAMVRGANAALRARLELSDADVLMAGMRL